MNQPQGSPASSAYSHPEKPVRHSYPLAITDAGLGTAVNLLVQTLPYALMRFGILVAVSVITMIWYVVTLGGGAWIGGKVPLLGWIWIIGGLGVWGYLWWFVVRYFLYLLKAGHIAVLTDLITTGRVGNGQEDMFTYGKRVVTERFGQVTALFALDAIVKGIVTAFNRTLGWIANLIPIPGLSGLVSIVNAIVRATTSYIDETIFSYSLARGDANHWRSAQDGLIYYAQNSKEVLKTGVTIVILDYVLTFVSWIACLLPAFLVASFFSPGGIAQFGVVMMAVLFAANLRAAFLKPLFLTMVMTKFHVCARNQTINPEWDQKLSQASDKFQQLKQQAQAAFTPSPQAPATPAPQLQS